MIITFVVNESDDPLKIGTVTNHELRIVQENSVPQILIDGQQAISLDRKTVQTTTIETFERISVTYVFPISQLFLDDEFRKSTAPYGQTVTIDMTDYPWINRTIDVVLDIEDITTTLVGCTHLRRSFNALVIES